MNHSLPTETLFTSPQELPTETDRFDEKTLLDNYAAKKLMFQQGEDLLKKLPLPFHLHKESQHYSTRSPPANDILSSNRGGEDDANELFPIKNQREDSNASNTNRHVINTDNTQYSTDKPTSRNNSSPQTKNQEEWRKTKLRNEQEDEDEDEANYQQQQQQPNSIQAIECNIPINTAKFMDNAQCSLENQINSQASPANRKLFSVHDSERHVQFDYKPQNSSRNIQTEGNLDSHSSQKKILANRSAFKSATQIINIKSSRLLNKKITEQQQQQQFQKEQQLLQQQKESANAIWGWINLKKRIDALKYLMRNIEMSGMIQIVSKLKDSHMNIIEDAGSDYTQDNRNSKNKQEELVNQDSILTKISFFFLKFFKLFPTISNNLLIVAIFKIMLSLQLLYQIFQLPLMLSFPDNTINIFKSDHPILRIWFVLPFILEIILNFNLSYYEHGERITSKFRIVSNYLQKDFLWDLAGVFGSGFIFQDANFVFIFGIFVLRFVKCKHMYDAIEEKFQLSLRFSVPNTLVNLFLSMTLVAHICGCIFQWIAVELSRDGIETWLQANHLQHSPISDRYIASLYFAFITMISVGYGDIVPISNLERIFVIIMTIFSCGVFAYVVSSISELFEISFQQESVYKQQKYEISNYMETRNINSDLQTKVFQFLEMLRTKKKQEPESGQGILDIMNPKLRQSIYQSYYGGHLLQWKLFANNFSQSFLEMLSVSCKEQVYGPGEIVFYQQESDQDFSEQGIAKFLAQNQSIYLIIKGEVLVYQESLKHQKTQNINVSNYKTVYSPGECFGVKEFLCGQPYEFTAQSKGLTTVMKIQREFFLDIIKDFPKDYEAFAFMRDELLFSKPDKYTKCQPCNRYDHSLYQCPRMHFLKRKLTTIYRFLYSEPQTRSKYSRSRDDKLHAIGEEHKHIRKQLKLFRVNLIRKLKHEEQQQINLHMNAFNTSLVSSGSKEKIDLLNLSKSKAAVDREDSQRISNIDKIKLSGSSSIPIKNRLGKLGGSTTSIHFHNSSKACTPKNIPTKKKKKMSFCLPQNNKKNQQSSINELVDFENNFQVKKGNEKKSSSKQKAKGNSKVVSKKQLNESIQLKNDENQVGKLGSKSEIEIEIEEGEENQGNNNNASNNNVSSNESSSGDENDSQNMDLSGKSDEQLRIASQDAQELMDTVNEEQDEMFFFKCPILFWSVSKQAYILSSQEDDLEGNQAIQQYLETNFEMCLDSEGELALPLEDCTEDNILENSDQGIQEQPSQDANSSSQLSQIFQMRPRSVAQNFPTRRDAMPSVQEAIFEEDFVKISANSLSFVDEQNRKASENYDSENIIYTDKNGADGQEILNAQTIFNHLNNNNNNNYNYKNNHIQSPNDTNNMKTKVILPQEITDLEQAVDLQKTSPNLLEKLSNEGLESEVISEEYNTNNDPYDSSPEQNKLKKQPSSTPNAKRNYGFNLDFSKLKTLPPVNVISDQETKKQIETANATLASQKKSPIKLDDIFRPSAAKQNLKLDQSNLLSTDPSSDTPRFRKKSRPSTIQTEFPLHHPQQELLNQFSNLNDLAIQITPSTPSKQEPRNSSKHLKAPVIKQEENTPKSPSLQKKQTSSSQSSKTMSKLGKLQTLLSISSEFTSHIISNHQLFKQQKQQQQTKEQSSKLQQQQQQIIQQLHQQQHIQQQLLNYQNLQRGSSHGHQQSSPQSPNKHLNFGHRFSTPANMLPLHQLQHPSFLNLNLNQNNQAINHQHHQNHHHNHSNNHNSSNPVNNAIISLNKLPSNSIAQVDCLLPSNQKYTYQQTIQQLSGNLPPPSSATVPNFLGTNPFTVGNTSSNNNSNYPSIPNFMSSHNNFKNTTTNPAQIERSGSITRMSSPSQAEQNAFNHNNIALQTIDSPGNATEISQSSSLHIYQPAFQSQQQQRFFLGRKSLAAVKQSNSNQNNFNSTTPQSMTSIKQHHSQLGFSDLETLDHRPAVPPTTEINIKPKSNIDNQVPFSIIFNDSDKFPEDIINEMLNFIFSFETAANFTKYYPKQNISNVMKKYIKYSEQRQLGIINNQMLRSGRNITRGNLFRKRKTEKFEKQ